MKNIIENQIEEFLTEHRVLSDCDRDDVIFDLAYEIAIEYLKQYVDSGEHEEAIMNIAYNMQSDIYELMLPILEEKYNSYCFELPNRRDDYMIYYYKDDIKFDSLEEFDCYFDLCIICF